jgi:DNA-binding transcriptional ArsR family regulator
MSAPIFTGMNVMLRKTLSPQALPSGVSMAEIGALVGDPARANMLTALMNGESLTASDLAWHAGVTPQTASGHLARMTEAELIKVTAQGRHRYYRLASPRVAQMLESIFLVAADRSVLRRRIPSYVDTVMRDARTCYDHLAGRLGVAIADALVQRRLIALDDEAAELTTRGRKFFDGLGIDLAAIGRKRRCFCRVCVDLTERRPHIAGAVGAAFCAYCFDSGWIQRVKDSRGVAITAKGSAGLMDVLGVAIPATDLRQRAA